MSRQLKPYIGRLTDTLREHNLYHERNDSLIKEVALAELIRDNYLDSLKGDYAQPLIRQTGCMGQTKIKINDIYVEVRKLLATIIHGKARLGLGNAATSAIQQQTETDLDRFIKYLEQ